MAVDRTMLIGPKPSGLDFSQSKQARETTVAVSGSRPLKYNESLLDKTLIYSQRTLINFEIKFTAPRMAFEGAQGRMANTLFPIYQASLSNGSVPAIFIPGIAFQETDVPWSRNAHDDPYELINCAQNHIKNRKPDVPDDGETELQGLVANILDEADSQDSLYSDGLGQRSKNIWSPKILRDELLQYFQSEDKTQYNSNFASNNYASHDAFGTQAQGQAVNKDTSSNGFNTNQLFNLPNGVHNSFSQPQKTPPGLTLPQKIPNAYLQLQANNYENGNDRANRESIGNFPDLNHIFRPQNDTDGSDLFNGNHYNQVTDKPAAGANEQYVSQDLNQLVRSFQSFPTGEQGRAAFENAPQREDNKWGSPNAFMQGANGSAEMQRRLGQDFGSKRSNRTKKQPTYRPSYSIPNPEYSPRQKLATGNRNTRLPFGANNFTARQIQQNPLKFKPQMQKERKRIDGYGDAVTATAEVLPEDKRLALSQNDFYDLPGSARPRRFDREDNMIQLQFPYAKNDPRRRPSQITNPNFSPRGSPVYSVGVPNMDVADVVSGGFNPASKDAIVRKGEGTYDSILPTPAARGGPVLLYYFYLEECYEQWRSLEKERKRTEIVLSKTFPGKGTLAFSNSSLPKTPTNPTRVDYLIVNQMREQAWVSFLLDKMECLSSVALSPNIYNALSKHHMAVSVTIARRKEEICNLRQRAHFTEERDTILLVVALKDLSATTRKLRTTVWCALQMTLPKCVPRLEPPVNQENQDEEGSALFEGYSYRM